MLRLFDGGERTQGPPTISASSRSSIEVCSRRAADREPLVRLSCPDARWRLRKLGKLDRAGRCFARRSTRALSCRQCGRRGQRTTALALLRSDQARFDEAGAWRAGAHTTVALAAGDGGRRPWRRWDGYSNSVARAEAIARQQAVTLRSRPGGRPSDSLKRCSSWRIRTFMPDTSTCQSLTERVLTIHGTVPGTRIHSRRGSIGLGAVQHERGRYRRGVLSARSGSIACAAARLSHGVDADDARPCLYLQKRFDEARDL